MQYLIFRKYFTFFIFTINCPIITLDGFIFLIHFIVALAHGIPHPFDIK